MPEPAAPAPAPSAASAAAATPQPEPARPYTGPYAPQGDLRPQQPLTFSWIGPPELEASPVAPANAASGARHASIGCPTTGPLKNAAPGAPSTSLLCACRPQCVLPRPLAPPQTQGESRHYSSFQFCDHRYEVGDHVYLIPEDAAAPLYLARIVDAFEDWSNESEGIERLRIEARDAACAAGCGGGSTGLGRAWAGAPAGFRCAHKHEGCSWEQTEARGCGTGERIGSSCGKRTQDREQLGVSRPSCTVIILPPLLPLPLPLPTSLPLTPLPSPTRRSNGTGGAPKCRRRCRGACTSERWRSLWLRCARGCRPAPTSSTA
jgi:hypothetical protein